MHEAALANGRDIDSRGVSQAQLSDQPVSCDDKKALAYPIIRFILSGPSAAKFSIIDEGQASLGGKKGPT